MAMTPAQKKATDAFARKLAESRRIVNGGSNSRSTVYNPATGRSWGSVEEYVEDPKKYGGGGGGSSRNVSQEIAKREADKTQALKVAQQKAISEAKVKLNEAQVQQEFKKILDARSRIIARGGRSSVQSSTDWKTKDKLKITTWKAANGGKVIRVQNLDKETVNYQSYERPRGGGNLRFVGGVTKGATPTIKEDEAIFFGGSKDAYFEYRTISTKDGIPNKRVYYVDTKRNVDMEVPFSVQKKYKLGGYQEHSVQPVIIVPAEVVKKKGSFWKGFQKTFVSKRFQSKEVKAEQKEKEKDWDAIIYKMSKGQKINQTDIKNFKEITKFTPEKLIDKDVARFAQITGGVIGTFVVPVPGAIIWAMGDTMESVRSVAADGGKISKQEFGKIVLDSATKGAIMGFAMKMLGGLSTIASKRVILESALRSVETNAVRAAVNNGGLLIKLVGRSGKNFISTYFMKDMIGNVFEVTRDVKAGNFNNALRKAVATGASIGGYIGGSIAGKATTKGALFVSGKLKATRPESVDFPRSPLDVMSKQLLSKGKIIITRRGVYESGKGLTPRKDAWVASRTKGKATKSIFWRFDKVGSGKDDAISPLPLFTKSKAGYYKMFKANWNKNKGMGLLRRYIKTSAETPLVTDVLMRQVVNLKDIKDLKLRKQLLKEYATTGKLSKTTQDKVLKNKLPISDKNREWGFHDENEYVMREKFKFKGRQDISWTYDASLKEYIPIVQNLKGAGRMKNFLSILNKKNIITRTDAKFIADNFAIKVKFGTKSILPKGHSMTHMNQVKKNMMKIIDKYPEFNSYWKGKYGSIANAKKAMAQALWHDIGKTEESSAAFGTPHGMKVWNVWKAKLLPKKLKFAPKVAKAIKVHETLDPRKVMYKLKNKIKLVSPEEKILATADRLDLARYKIKIDLNRLPLKDAIKRLKLKVDFTDYPTKFSSIINRIKAGKIVKKGDIAKLLTYSKKAGSSIIKKLTYKTSTWKGYKNIKAKNSYKAGWTAGNKVGLKSPTNYNPKYKGTQSAYTSGFRDAYSGKYSIDYKTGKYKVKRPTKRPTKRPSKRPTKRQTKRVTPRATWRSSTKKRKKPTTFKLPKNFKRKSLSKKQPTFYIKIKRRGKIVNLTPRPLTQRDAKDFLAYSVDNGLERSAWFEPLGKSKKAVSLPRKMVGYFAKNKRKLRAFKIKVGKKKAIRNGYIEKRKFILDTKREKGQMRTVRRKAKRRVVKRKPVRKRVIKKRVVKRKPIRRKAKRRVVKRKPKLKRVKRKKR